MRIEPRTIPARHTAVMKATLHARQLSAWIPTAFDRVAGYLQAQDIAPSGMPFARFHVLPDPPTGDPRFWRTEVAQPFTPTAAPANQPAQRQ
jgi:hypothetical protein